jgi:hypothetical protein
VAKERQSRTHSNEGRLQEVTHGRCRTLRLGVAVLDTRKLKNTLASRGSDDTGTTRRRDETAHNRSNLARDLAGHGMGVTELGTPVSTTNRDARELAEDDGTPNGGGDLLRALDTKADMAVRIADGDERLETRALAGTGLLLHGHDLHHLVLELGEEEVDYLILLHGEREQIDLLHRLDLAILHETAEFGDGDPVKYRIRMFES